jgi:hypothetical protein
MRALQERPAPRPTRRPRRPRAGSTPLALELQRSAGNAAVAGLIQREAAVDLPPRRPTIKPNVVFMAGEQVEVANKEEQHEAERILVEIRNTYGIRLSSPMAKAGLVKFQKEFAGDAKGLEKVDYTTWKLSEIRALGEALKKFAPILGKKRAQSARKGKWQEVTSIGKLTSPNGLKGDTTDAQAFGDLKTLALFEGGTEHPGVVGDFGSDQEYLVATVIHELTHNLLEYALEDWERSLTWWSGDKQGEAPINAYADTNANEDLSESMAYYFLEPDKLQNGVGGKPGEIGNPCRKRFELVDKYVKNWQSKRS